jgi:hypothetical protein
MTAYGYKPLRQIFIADNDKTRVKYWRALEISMRRCLHFYFGPLLARTILDERPRQENNFHEDKKINKI